MNMRDELNGRGLNACDDVLDTCQCGSVCSAGRRYMRLTDDLVDRLRGERGAGEKLEYLAAKYGVHLSTVWRICNGRTR